MFKKSLAFIVFLSMCGVIFASAAVVAEQKGTALAVTNSKAESTHQNINWPKGKRAAIVLTYDDRLYSQLNFAVPQLNKAHLKGTFFLKGEGMTPADMILWRQVAAAGHELGNHTIYHPCPRAIIPNREHYVTESYDPQSMLNEISVMNAMLFGVDDKQTIRTMSYPCSQTIVGGTDYMDALRHSGLIKYVRNGGNVSDSIVRDFFALDFYNIPSNGPTHHPNGAELVAYVKQVQEAGGLGVFQFHGVGGDYLEVSAEAHQELISHLRSQPDIWVGTFQQVMDYVADHRAAR